MSPGEEEKQNSKCLTASASPNQSLHLLSLILQEANDSANDSAIDFFWLGRWFGRRPEAGGRWPVAGGRWPVAGGRWAEAGGRWPVAGGRGPVAGGRGPGAGGRWPVLCMFRLPFLISICFFSMALLIRFLSLIHLVSLFGITSQLVWDRIHSCLFNFSVWSMFLFNRASIFKPPWLSRQTCLYNQPYLFN